MKKVFQTSELVHIWARQTQDEGRNSNGSVFFNRTKIYSYGHHFCMANIIKPGIVLVTNRKYSVTTSSHLSAVSHAVNHLEEITVPYPENEDLAKNLAYYTSDIKDQIAVINNTRKKPETKDQAKTNLSMLVKNVNRFLEVTGQTISKKLIGITAEQTRKEFLLYFEVAKNLKALPDLQRKVEARNKAKAKEEQKRNAEQLEKAKADLLRWRKGERVYVYSSAYSINGLPVYIRTDKDKEIIETSGGARVSYKAGKLLYARIKAGKDVKGHDIDGYTVISVNGSLKIGCHEIDMKEVERFAKSQKW